MRTIAGSIVILAGVIALCFGFMLGHANWYQHHDVPRTLQIGGMVGAVIGALAMFWGFATESVSVRPTEKK